VGFGVEVGVDVGMGVGLGVEVGRVQATAGADAYVGGGDGNPASGPTGTFVEAIVVPQ
jgi:hypothetical protein